MKNIGNTTPVKVFLTLAFFFCFNLTASALKPELPDKPAKERIVVEPLFDRYLLTDTIFLPVINTSDTILYFSLALERKTEPGWQTVAPDMLKSAFDRHKAHNIKVSQPSQLTVMQFVLADLPIIMNLPKEISGEYRFCFFVKESPFYRGGEKYYSTTFALTDSINIFLSE